MADSIFRDRVLKDHVAFVTGGGTGITGGVARALAEAGASVALVSRSLEHLEPAAKAINDARTGVRSPTEREGNSGERASRAVRAGMPALPATGGEAFAVVADVRKPEEVEKAIAATVERFGKIDIVVNGAAGNFLCAAEELSPNGFGTVVDIDLKGTFNVCRAAFAELKKNRGQILNISATLHYLGTPMQLHVSAAKAGVDALTTNLAVEWGHYGIRVNAIAPGPIGDTEGMKRLVPEPIKEKLRKRIPLGRFGLIQDIENAAVFLCSDAASYINGAVIVVDGGHWLAASRLI
ncbi:MAG TPA: SDR family oxidoreductase [Pyrinomonadaceae bacterium]|nr:SDR family oxidoreductase [Pyrinomonadaceae bacterium]